MRAWITGIGWMTPAGLGQGRQTVAQPLVTGSLELPRRKDVFAQADLRFGRLDGFSRVGLAALACCLRDAGAEEWTEKRPIGIVAGSSYGCLQTDLDYLETLLTEGGKLASPNLFAYTLPNCFLGEAALRFGLTGNTLVLNRADESGLAPLRFALEELAWSEQTGVLAGRCDLEAPAGVTAAGTPGGLFLLLEPEPAAAGSYGELQLAGEKLLFAGAEVSDLAALVAACLAVRP
jgi:3-oxoacyl-[acyl-carrier-protein] synthase II